MLLFPAKCCYIAGYAIAQAAPLAEQRRTFGDSRRPLRDEAGLMRTISELRMAWLEIVGPEIAGSSFPRELDERGILVVFVDPGADETMRGCILPLVTQAVPNGIGGRRIEGIAAAHLCDLALLLRIGRIHEKRRAYDAV